MPFETTRWSVVYTMHSSDPQKARHALETLCLKYWRPLYYFAIRRGLSADLAQDATQDFFAHLIEKGALKRLDHTKGKFRTFLLTAFTNMLNNEWDKQRAQKRNPGKPLLPLSVFEDGIRYKDPVAENMDPELLFDREWAMTVLRESLESLRTRYKDEGKQDLIQELIPYLTTDHGNKSYGELGGQLGMSTNAIKVAVHRARRRYREEIRGHVAETVRFQEEVDEELHHLFDILLNVRRASP